MRPSYCIAATATTLVFLTATSAGAQTVRVGGTGAATALMQSLASAFSETSENPVDVIPSLGSNGAIRAVAAGALDIAGLFDAGRTTWPDGFPLRIVMRPRSESDTALIGALFPEAAVAMERARARPEIPIAATDQDNADLAERLKGSLTGATLTQIMMEKRPLSFVDIDGVKPTLENLQSGAYPYAKTLYMIATKARRPSVDTFIAFLLTPTGRMVLREDGVLGEAGP